MKIFDSYTTWCWLIIVGESGHEQQRAHYRRASSHAVGCCHISHSCSALSIVRWRFMSAHCYLYLSPMKTRRLIPKTITHVFFSIWKFQIDILIEEKAKLFYHKLISIRNSIRNSWVLRGIFQRDRKKYGNLK